MPSTTNHHRPPPPTKQKIPAFEDTLFANKCVKQNVKVRVIEGKFKVLKVKK